MARKDICGLLVMLRRKAPVFFLGVALGDSGGGFWSGKVKNHERAATKFQARSEIYGDGWPSGD